ncbi:MAG: glycoside hydrolase family 47 protein, partial [Bacteroidota bacterium]
MEPGDEMSTFLFAESLKYFYLAFAPENDWQLGEVVFSTEAHPFRLAKFDHARAKERLGY